MSTNLDDLGLELGRALAALPDTSAGAASAAAAAGQLARGIATLSARGFMKDEHLTQRDLAAAELARSCRELASTAPSVSDRTVDLAGVIADATCLQAASLDPYQRWAVASALCDHLEDVISTVSRLSSANTGGSVLAAEADERVVALQQLTSTHPARRSDNAALELPIANPWNTIGAHPSDASSREAVTEGIAQLLAIASPEHGPWAVDEALAVGLACRQVTDVLVGDGGRRPAQFWPAHVTATDSWEVVVRRLSKLQQPGVTAQLPGPAPVAAVASDVAANAARCAPADLADAAQRLPMLAEFMAVSVSAWLSESTIFVIDRRGDRTALLRANADTLRPLTQALADTRKLADALADRAGREAPIALRRTWLVHHEAANLFGAENDRGEAQARVHAALTRPATPRRGRAR